jgi:hypothetical protein
MKEEGSLAIQKLIVYIYSRSKRRFGKKPNIHKTKEEGEGERERERNREKER